MNSNNQLNKYTDCEKFKFGDSETLCIKLTNLVRDGKKTATCEALNNFFQNDETLPVVGRTDIVLNWDGTPSLAIQTKSVDIVKFCDVSEEFALQEGENETLKEWQEDHKTYFKRNGGFDHQMKLVCECFEIVEVFGN